MLIGITGGVGAGKSKVLKYLESEYGIKVYMADVMADELMKPKSEIYEDIRKLFPDRCFLEDGTLNRGEMAKEIFLHNEKRQQLNNIVFPVVKEKVIAIKNRTKNDDIVIFEAALLIEEHYNEICDEMWYIYADEGTRKARLMENRGYSEERVNAVMKTQLTEDDFRAVCDVVINNGNDLEETYRELDNEISRIGVKR